MKDFVEYNLSWIKLIKEEKYKSFFIKPLGGFGHDYFSDYRWKVKTDIPGNIITMCYMHISTLSHLKYNGLVKDFDIDDFIKIYENDYKEKLPKYTKYTAEPFRGWAYQMWYLWDLIEDYNITKKEQ